MLFKKQNMHFFLVFLNQTSIQKGIEVLWREGRRKRQVLFWLFVWQHCCHIASNTSDTSLQRSVEQTQRAKVFNLCRTKFQLKMASGGVIETSTNNNLLNDQPRPTSVKINTIYNSNNSLNVWDYMHLFVLTWVRWNFYHI